MHNSMQMNQKFGNGYKTSHLWTKFIFGYKIKNCVIFQRLELKKTRRRVCSHLFLMSCLCIHGRCVFFTRPLLCLFLLPRLKMLPAVDFAPVGECFFASGLIFASINLYMNQTQIKYLIFV